MSDFTRFRIEKEGFIRWLILSRPDKRNAMDEDFFRELTQAFTDFDQDPEVRAVVVRGEGKGFSAGIDLGALGGLVQSTSVDAREQLRFFGGLMQWMGFPTASIDVQHDERFDGKSSYTFAKLAKLATETIIAYSDKPLRLSIRIGFMISGLAFSYGGYIVYRALAHDAPVSGWSSLIVSIYFLGGVIISILGIIGVYLGKTFDESKRRPLYIVSRSTFNRD